jgi:predicted phage replisome organizer
MAEGKRYYWLKLKSDFFTSKRIKKLRKMAGGDTYTIIYLKMQLLSIRSNGILKWTGLEDNFAAELALDLDESVEDVRMTLMYLESCGLIETSDNVNYFLPYVVENTGSENASAQRVRDFRERQKLLQCNTDVTEVKRQCSVEKEIELEIEKDKEIDIRQKRKRFVPPTLEEVESYCKERNNSVDAKAFYDYYSAGEWKDSKGNPVKNWKQKLITWEKGDNSGRNKSVSAKNQTDNREPETDYSYLYDF